MKRFLILVVLVCLLRPAAAQQGTVVYNLPQTCVRIHATAVCQQFTAGPYARYAKKFLGIEAAQQNSTNYTLTGIALYPTLEADPHHLYMVTLPSRTTLDPWIMQLTSQGLILLSDSQDGKERSWRFPSQVGAQEVSDAGVIDNLTEQRATLYRSEPQGQSITQIPVQQSQLVEKPLEQRAQEAARHIFQLRAQRLAIITGDTDATFSGEALGQAVAEMRRMEEEYLTLFLGTTTYTKTHLTCEVVPQSDRTKYVAFRLSETEGLLPGSNVEGRPIVLDISEASAPGILPATGNSKGAQLRYRMPRVMQLRLLDGGNELLQTRMPLYQYGQIVPFSVN